MSQNNQVFTNLYKRGLSVFALPYAQKQPTTSWKSYQDNKPSTEQCFEWDQGKHNVAIVTGKISGVFVVDIDGEEGEQTICAFEAKYGHLPQTRTSKTGRGRHLYFSYPTDGPIIHNLAGKTTHGEVMTGVDIRGEGGYVVAPPSMHPNGHAYEWIEDLPIVEAPKWLLEKVSKNSTGYVADNSAATHPCVTDALTKHCQILLDTPEGERNNQLNKSAFCLGQLVTDASSESHIIQKLKDAAESIGLDHRETERTLDSGISAGKLNPKPMAFWDAPDMRVAKKQITALPDCPAHLLPGALQQFVHDAAACKSAPKDYILASLLCTAAGLIGNARRIEIWSGWSEPTALWFLLVGLPSCNKSPALDAVLRVVHAFEAEKNQQYVSALRQYEQDLEAYKAKKTGTKDDIGLREPDKPKMKRLVVNDATIEKLALLLADNPKGLICARDEIAGMLANLERNGGNDRPFYLESFGGRPMSIDRVKHDNVIYVPSVLLSIVGSIQPDKLDQLLLRQPDDGLASRFIYIAGTPRKIKEPDVVLKDEMLAKLFKKLENLNFNLNESNVPDPQIIRLCEQGRRLMEEFSNRLQAFEEKEYGVLLSHLGKLRGIAGRLALVLHYLEWAIEEGAEEPSVISYTHVENAIFMAEEYFYPMAKHCLSNVAAAQDEQDAMVIARWILDHKTSIVNAREILRNLIPQRDTRRRDAALSYLEESGWLAKKETNNRSVEYHVNPKIYD